MSLVTNPHGMSVDAVFSALITNEGGLSQAESIERLSTYGKNSLPAAQPRPSCYRFVSQFNNVLIYVLKFLNIN